MKQYTTSEQTAKLIELGFEKPMSIEEFLEPESDWSIGGIKQRKAYSIGELLSVLPKEIDCNGFKNTLYIFVNQGVWVVEYSDFLGELYSTYRTELIDAVFDVCVKLKEEGVI
jgi:hypothetical protein